MTNFPEILLVEDEERLNEVIAMNLTLEGYRVTSVFDGDDVSDELNKKKYHLIILDIMLPNQDGFSICETIRKQNQKIQILMISARASSEDKIHGLKLGADDYLPKPFDLEELMLRVKSLLKRHSDLQQLEETYQFGPNQINFSNYYASNGTEDFQLTKRELKLLELFVKKEGEAVSREEILQEVWGYEEVFPNTRTIDNFILNFRKYFEENPKEPKYFESVWGVGYRFVQTPKK